MKLPRLTREQVSMLLSMAAVQCPACAQMHRCWARPGSDRYDRLGDALCLAGCWRPLDRVTPERLLRELEKAGLA